MRFSIEYGPPPVEKMGPDKSPGLEWLLFDNCGWVIPNEIERRFVIFGPRGRGKTTLSEAMRRLLGPFVREVRS